MVPEESYSPFWKNCGNRLGAFDPNLVVSEIEVGQRADEKSKNSVETQNRAFLGQYRSHGDESGARRKLLTILEELRQAP